MKRWLICSSCAFFLIFAAMIAPIPAHSRPSAYSEAKGVFQSDMNVGQRLLFQVWLIAAGYSNAMPNEDFNRRTFEAIQRFQEANGFDADGIVSPEQRRKLEELAIPMFDLWGFRIVTHLYRLVNIWIPLGLGLHAQRNNFGLRYTDSWNRILIDFTTVQNLAVGRNFIALVNSLLQQRAIIHYKVFKDGWFAISASTPDGADWYLRYHQDGTNVTGFTLQWKNANGDVHAERIAVLMSASLWSNMTGAAFVQPPPMTVGASSQAAPPSSPPAVIASIDGRHHRRLSTPQNLEKRSM